MIEEPAEPAHSGDELPLGERIARLRRRAVLTGTQLGQAAGMSQAKISRIENGLTAVDPQDVFRLARVLNASEDDTRRLLDLAERGHNRMTDWRPTQLGAAGRQREFEQLEAATREFRVFQPTVVVGLLQTSEYARAVLSRFTELSANRTAPSNVDVSEAVSARVRRHQVLAEAGKHFRFVMAESVLMNRLCRPADMLAQLDRIREVARQSNVTVTMVPADAPWPIPPYHGFELLDDRSVSVDLFNTTTVSRGRADIRQYRELFDKIEECGTTRIDPLLDRYFDLYLDLSRQSRAKRTAQA